MPNAPAAGQALAVLQLLARHAEPVPAAAIARDLGPARARRLPPARGAAPTRASSPTCPRSAATAWAWPPSSSGSAYPRQEPLQRIARPVLARLVDATDAQRPPRRAARPRRALRHRGARGRPAAAGHRRRRPAAGPPDRQRPGDARRAAAGAGPGALSRPAPPSCSATASGPGRCPRCASELTRVRRDGYAHEDGSVTPGFASVAVGRAGPRRPPGRRRRGHLPGARGDRGGPGTAGHAGRGGSPRAVPPDPRPRPASGRAPAPGAARAGSTARRLGSRP